MRHDVFEVVTGDVLLPVKIHSNETKRKWEEIEEEIVEAHPLLKPFTDTAAENYFTHVSWKLFKACDLLELYIFCEEELALGNHGVGVITVLRNCAKLLPEFGFVTITKYVHSA